MTITTLEEHDEAAQLQSEPSSPVSNNVSSTLLDEMKYEMYGSKSALTSSMQERVKIGTSAPSNAPLLLGDHRNAEHLSVSGLTRSQLTSLPNNTGISQTGNVSTTAEQRTTTNHLPEKSAAQNMPARSVSADTVNSISILPARTRLRRQRRMGSQGSTDEPEDPIERLNRLRARISGALNEVKGVLNKYSTETEPTQEVTPQADKKLASETVNEEDGPIKFRFIKKVRRRSVFNENEEDKNKEASTTETSASVTPQIPAEQTEIEAAEKTKTEITHESNKILEDFHEETQSASKTMLPNIEITKPGITTAKTASYAGKTDDKNVLKLKLKLPAEPEHNRRRVSIATVNEISSLESLRDVKTKRRPSDSAAIIKRSSAEIEARANEIVGKVSKGLKKSRTLSCTKPDEAPLKKNGNVCSKEALLKGVQIKPMNLEMTTPNEATAEQPKKPLSKKQDVNMRRSSIAAVEMSKIEPPIMDSIKPDNIKAQRRPSDSAAIVKKSLLRYAAIKEETKLEAKNKIQSSSKVKAPNDVSKSSALAASNAENNSKDVALATSASSGADKENLAKSINSIKLINDKTSITESMQHAGTAPLPATPATVIGKATTIALENALTPSAAAAADIFEIAKDSKSHTETANAAVPLSQPPVNETSSQVTQSSSAIRAGIEPATASTEKAEQQHKSTQSEEKANETSAERAVTINGAINQVAAPTDNDDDSEELIYQREKTPTIIDTPSKSTSTTSSAQSSRSPLQTTTQQVAADAGLAVIAIGDDIRVHDRNIVETQKSLSEVNVATSTTLDSSSSTHEIATKTSAATIAANSALEQITTESAAIKSTKPHADKESESAKKVPTKMPELQALPVPVKPVQVHAVSETPAPFNLETKEAFPKKKVAHKKLLRQKSAEKQQPKQPPKTTANSNDQTVPHTDKEPAAEPVVQQVPEAEDETPAASESCENLQITGETAPTVAPTPPPPLPPPRKVKKKVIIKRLQRRLSASEPSFFVGENDESPLPDVETLEKAIAYVTDDEQEDEEEPVEPVKPLKSCMRLREYQIGDRVLYGERYKKTLIRWKKGRITERITSISYKVDLGDKEVSSHINYLKKYHGRNVRFGGKEYLEINYEQLTVEEEKKVRPYSIWNLV